MKLSKFFALTALVLAPVAAQADYKLSEFAGEYIAQSYTAGAPNITAISPQYSPTVNFIAVAKVDKKGHGKVLYISTTEFYGPVPTSLPGASNVRTVRTETGAPEFQVSVSLTNKDRGTGTFTIFDFPVKGVNLVNDFIAVKQDKKIVKILLNSVSDPQFSGIGPFVAERR
jgi:hypothetical protein